MGKRVKRTRSTSLLSYWTIRYFIILCIGFTIIAAAAIYWMRDATMESRLQTAGLLGQEVADRVTSPEGQLTIPPKLDYIVKNRLFFFNIDEYICVMITDQKGDLKFSRPAMTEQQMHDKLTDDLSQPRDDRYVAITTPIDSNNEQLGKVIILQSKRALTYSPQEMMISILLLAILILSGWLTLYLLSRKLARPLSSVADAAQQIRQGNYDVQLNIHTPEREIQQLVSSFEDMAKRLKHLEEWRALSLAGVTHELKTPVTSIKGLVMAVRDEVVVQEEAQEFLDIALKESDRMERMVADLLDYNAFASGSVEVRQDDIDLPVLIAEVIYQWNLLHDSTTVRVTTDLPPSSLYTVGDALRIQQIMVNLLNNSLQATASGQTLDLHIRMYTEQQNIQIEVTDNGTGVAPEEQDYVFERFYRGEHKKRAVRGLGLGLTYSQLLARAQHGEIVLKHSSSTGTTFVLKMPLSSDISPIQPAVYAAKPSFNMEALPKKY
ncbi:HAMP domain-containing sensor histidine kinase [Paenibacillus shenyangensis]|uniref:HAMP domain-containing sensor histidine kinase n=1 Tax=Paenibacillus sp. A9 TaxID=1284352 RepID=UPI000AEEC5CE|nr:HAMP domain-containing sensor histidine kinase [Paenibacillus sp. A9]